MELIFDFSSLLKYSAMVDLVTEGKLPNLEKQFEVETFMIFNQWRQMASEAKGLYRRTEYLEGLQIESSIAPINVFHNEIIHTRPDIAKSVHKGIEAHDMKPYLLGTMTFELTKSGRRGNTKYIYDGDEIVGKYNTVPLRHKVENMPTSVYSRAKDMVISQTSLEGEGTVWGERLPVGKELRKLISTNKQFKEQYTQAMKNRKIFGRQKISAEEFAKSVFGGMVKLGKEEGRHTQYKTFRRVSERFDGRGGSDKDSWWYPAKPPLPIPIIAMDILREGIHKRLKSALLKDLREMAG